ncbi:MAG: hypothetical protein V3W51_05900, partial [Candidatus Brocadiales bacterium]
PNSLFVKRTSQFVEALRIKQFDVSDGVTMLVFQWYITKNNFDRANLLIDWIQDVGGDFNSLMGEPFFHGEKGLLPGVILNVPIDTTQAILKKLVKIMTEAGTRLGYRTIFGVEHSIGAVHNATVKKTWQTPEVVSAREDSPFEMLDISE